MLPGFKLERKEPPDDRRLVRNLIRAAGVMVAHFRAPGGTCGIAADMVESSLWAVLKTDLAGWPFSALPAAKLLDILAKSESPAPSRGTVLPPNHAVERNVRARVI